MVASDYALPLQREVRVHGNFLATDETRIEHG